VKEINIINTWDFLDEDMERSSSKVLTLSDDSGI